MEIADAVERYYLLDYDNVGQNGIYGIENLSKKDKAVIFYTENKNSIELSFFEKIHASKAEIIFQKTETSFKCLFSSYLGYIVGMNPNAEYHIISNEKEYWNLKKFWAEKEIEINISSDIVGNTKKEELIEEETENAIKEEPIVEKESLIGGYL